MLPKDALTVFSPDFFAIVGGHIFIIFVTFISSWKYFKSENDTIPSTEDITNADFRKKYFYTTRKIKMFKPNNGLNSIRLLNPGYNCAPFEMKQVHYIKMKENQSTKVYQCPNTIKTTKWSGDCPFCKHYEKLILNSNNKLNSWIDVFKPSIKYYYNIFAYNDFDGSFYGPYVWKCGFSIHEQISKFVIEENIELFDLNLGRCLQFQYSENDKYKKYSPIKVSKYPCPIEKESDLFKNDFKHNLKCLFDYFERPLEELTQELNTILRQ